MEEAEKKNDIAELTRTIIEKLLNLMGISATVVPVAEAPGKIEAGIVNTIAFDLKGEDLGILIGRRGQTLASLQYIVRLIVGHLGKVWVPIIIDIEGYKKRRYESLQALAWRMAEQVKARRMPFALEPMPPSDRRIIHLVLADHPDVTTQSSGEGEARRVVIIPKEQFR